MRGLGLVLGLALAAVVPASAQAKMTVALGAPWDGKRVPGGQQCQLHGGKGATPPMTVTGLPRGTVSVVVAFNDLSFGPLSRNGGHGTIGFPVRGAAANLPAVPGMTARLPGNAVVVAKALSTGQYASPGYLPPCSGGQNNRYVADVSAVGADGKVLETLRVDIGRY